MSDLPPEVSFETTPRGRVGEEIQLKVLANDPNGDDITSIEWSLKPVDSGRLEGTNSEAIMIGDAPGQYQVHVRVESSGGVTEAAINVVLDPAVGCGCQSRGDLSGWLLILSLWLLRRRRYRAA